MSDRSDTYPGSIDRPGTSWRWRVSVAGERHSYTLPRDGDRELPADPDKSDVAAFARREYDKLEKDARKGRTRAAHFSELLKRFVEDKVPDLAKSSARDYRDAVARFRLYFVDEGSDPLVRDMTPGDVDAFLSWRKWHSPDGTKRDEALSALTVNKDRAILSRIFDQAMTWGHRGDNPVLVTDERKADSRTPYLLDPEEYEALLKAAEDSKNPMARTYILLLGETGLRSNSEALWLRWSDIDLEERQLEVVSGRGDHRTKGGTSRKVPLTPRLRKALREHMAEYRMQTYGGQRSPWVFHHTFSYLNVEAGDRINDMRAAFVNAADRAGLPDRFRKHDLRHRRVTTWLNAGHSPVHVQQAMGHSDLKTTMEYYEHTGEHLDALLGEPGKTEKPEEADLGG